MTATTYLHYVSVVCLSLPHGCSVAAVFKHRCVVIHIQQVDGNPAVSCLQSVVSQHHQLDVWVHLEIQTVVLLYTDLAWNTAKGIE